MKPTEYKRFVAHMIAPPKIAKPGVRKAIATKKAVNIFHSVLGLSAESGELMEALNLYVLGFPLTDTMRKASKEELGDLTFFAVALARDLKVKVPAFTRKPKMKNTPLVSILAIQRHATAMLDLVKKAFYGEEINHAALASHLQELLPHLYALPVVLFAEPLASLVEDNVVKLKTRYPEKFTQHGAINRDYAREQAAVEAAAKAKISAKPKTGAKGVVATKKVGKVKITAAKPTVAV